MSSGRVRPVFITPGQAARRLGVSVRSMQNWTKAGQIAPDWRTPGGHMRWDVQRVLRELAPRIGRLAAET